MANSVDPDETPRSAASHLSLHCLLRTVCQNTWGIYGIQVYTLLSIFSEYFSFFFKISASSGK